MANDQPGTVDLTFPRVSEVQDESGSGSGQAGRWLLLAVAIGTTLAPLNSTMIAIALPDIQSALDVSVISTTWLVTLYLVAMAVGQPIGGRLGDLYGRRRVYLLGLAWFGLASAGCAIAPNLDVLIFLRIQQAIAGALSFPNGVAMIRENVPQDRRGSAFGVIGLATGLAAASGPPIGGILVHSFGWSAIFWANVPVVGVALLLGWRSLPRQALARGRRSSFDLIGTGLFGGTLGAVIIVPTLLKLHQPVFALLSGAVMVLLGIWFIRWELRTTEPMMNVRLFRQAHFAAACASIAVSNLVMYTTLLAMPLYLEQVRGHSVQVAGVVLAALSALAAVAGPLGGRWMDRRGRWLPAVAGGVAVLIGAALLASGTMGAALTPVIVALAMMGIGIGLSSAAVQTAALEAVPVESTGSAAGIYSTSRYLGSVVGSSILAVVFVSRPNAGEANRFATLFVGLSMIAALGLLINTRVATRRTA